jgi:spermidine/putrescine transport system substrate-binding protein
MNFIMAPENAALISNFATYANGIMGSEKFMKPELKDAPELSVPAEFQKAGEWIITCPPEVNEVYSKIWKDLLK